MSQKALAKDAAASVGRHVATAVVGMVSLPIIARALGATLLGFWSLLGTVAFLVGLCDLGLNAATLRAAAGDDPALAKRVARYATRTTLLTIVPVALACAAWLFVVAEQIPADQRTSARAAVVIALVAGMLNAAVQPWRSYAQGRGRIMALARARTAGAVVQLAATIALLALHLGVQAVAIGYALGTIVDAVLAWVAVRDEVVSSGLPTAEERKATRLVARASFVTNLSVAVAIRTDVIVLQQVSSLETIAAYSVASRLVDQGFTLVKQVSAALVPRLGARARDAERTVLLGTMVLGALAAAPLAVVAVAARPVIVAWAGPAVDLPVVTVAGAWLALAALVAATEEIAASRMSLAGDPRIVARAIGAGSIVNVAASIVGAYAFGPAAVAAATLFGNIVTATIIWHATMRSLSWKVRRLAVVFAPPAVAALVTGALTVVLLRCGAPALIAGAVAACAGLLGGFVAMKGELRTPAVAVP